MIFVKSIIIDHIWKHYVDKDGNDKFRRKYYKRQAKFVMCHNRWRGWMIEYNHPLQTKPWYVYILNDSKRYNEINF